MSQVLSVFECSGIQPYVFGSDRLRENLGASQLVHEALEDDLMGALPPDSIKDWSGGSASSRQVPDRAEVVYVGGGSAVVMFPSREQAIKATRRWSRLLLEKAPGLRPVAAHVEDDGSGSGFLEMLSRAFEELERVKLRPPGGWKLEALPVTRRCVSTGLGANRYVEYGGGERQWLSSVAAAKREPSLHSRADERIRRTVGNVLPEGFEWTDDLSELAQRGESPQIAVIHIDGNQVGMRLQEAAKDAEADADAVAALRGFSAGVTDAARGALRAMMARIAAMAPSLREEESNKSTASSAPKAFPARLVVFGGDDITLVTDGRIGVQSAAAYLGALAEQQMASGEPLTACAGVAIVGSHFPFSRAYELADDLCRKAKTSSRPEGGSWLDFQISVSGGGNLDALREAYTVGGTTLLWRPWRVWPDETGGHDFSLLLDMVDTFRGWPRWRTKELYSAYHLRGPDGVAEILAEYEADHLDLPTKMGDRVQHLGGYSGCATAYVDALEMEEFLVADKPAGTSEGMDEPRS